MRIKGSALGHAGKDLYLWHIAVIKVKVDVIGERSFHEEVAKGQPEKGLDRQWRLGEISLCPTRPSSVREFPEEENEEGNEQQHRGCLSEGGDILDSTQSTGDSPERTEKRGIKKCLGVKRGRKPYLGQKVECADCTEICKEGVCQRLPVRSYTHQRHQPQ